MILRSTLRACTLAALLCGSSALSAQQAARAQTLADLRQDMSVLFVEMQRLKRELSTTGASPVAPAGSYLDRITSIEGELQRLTGKIEELEFRITQIVKDGTNRLGDLEFRLVELEGGDTSTLAQTSTLGGGSAPAAAPEPATPEPSDIAGAGDLAIGERADFEAAQAALNSGDARGAAELFGLFTQNYPGSPLEGQARLQQGAAFEAAGDPREAARAYLDAYSGAPSGANAPEALFRLGRALGRLGKVSEACVTLGEVSVRHPGTEAVSAAQNEMTALQCS